MIYSNNVVLRVSDVSTGIAKPDSKPGPCDDDKAYYVRVTGVPKGGYRERRLSCCSNIRQRSLRRRKTGMSLILVSFTL